MKRLILFGLILISIGTRAQISDALLQDTIDLQIVTNATKSITAAQLNAILTHLNENKLHVDSAAATYAPSADSSMWSLSGVNITNKNTGTVIIDSLLKIYPMPPGVLAAMHNPYKFMVMGNDGRVWWANALEASAIIEDTISDRAAAGSPPVTATWVRDTTNGELYPATSTDIIDMDTTKGDKTSFYSYFADSVMCDSSSFTGADLSMTHTYEAFKFIADKNYALGDLGPIAIFLKKDGTITNVTGAIQKYIYTDNAGVPGTALTSITEPEMYGHISTSYAEYPTQNGSPELTAGTAYWIVCIRTGAPSGGNVYVKTTTTAATNRYAYSSNGSSWTKGNYKAAYIIYFEGNPVINVANQHHYGIETYSETEYGMHATSIYDAAVRGVSINAEGLQGNSTYSTGVNGNSTHGVGINGVSTNNSGGYFSSTNYYGVIGTTAKTGYAAIYGQANISGGRGGAFEATNSYGVVSSVTTGNAFYGNSSSGTTLYLYKYGASANSTTEIAKLELGTASTAAAGHGQMIAFYNEDSGGASDRMGGISCKSQSATANKEGGALVFSTYGTVAGFTDKMQIDSVGYISNPSGSLVLKDAVVNPMGTIADNDTSPDFAGGNVWKYNGTANSVSIVSIDNEVVGAFYTIIGNSGTYTITVVDGTPGGGDSFNLSGSNFVGGQDDVLLLYCYAANNFIEVSRSDN